MRTDSPEDRLLRLIKGKYRGNGLKKAPLAEAKETAITGVSKKIFLQNKALKPIFSDSVNRILVIILIVLAAYLAYSFIFPPYKGMNYFAENMKGASGSVDRTQGSSAASRVQDYSVYSKAIGRDLFSTPLAEEAEGASSEAEIDITTRFNLVGIIAGEDPQAIIEDKEAKKTHYLHKGQSLNGVTITEIAEGRVVLEYNGKEAILVL